MILLTTLHILLWNEVQNTQYFIEDNFKPLFCSLYRQVLCKIPLWLLPGLTSWIKALCNEEWKSHQPQEELYSFDPASALNPFFPFKGLIWPNQPQEELVFDPASALNPFFPFKGRIWPNRIQCLIYTKTVLTLMKMEWRMEESSAPGGAIVFDPASALNPFFSFKGLIWPNQPQEELVFDPASALNPFFSFKGLICSNQPQEEI